MRGDERNGVEQQRPIDVMKQNESARQLFCVLVNAALVSLTKESKSVKNDDIAYSMTQCAVFNLSA
jgi:hypothetical protein